jgi:YVTN family beta-propeller protein
MATLTLKVMMLQRPQLLAASALLIVAALAMPAQAQYVEDSIDVGGAWVGNLVYSSANDAVYGTSTSADLVYAISCVENRVTGTATLSRALDLAYDSIDNKLFVTYEELDQGCYVGVIDCASMKVTHRIGMDGATRVVWSGEFNRAYVSCGDYDRVAVINCANDSLERLIQVPGYPIGMDLNTVHHKLYVRNWDGNSVSIIDLNTHQVSEPIGTDGTPECGHYSSAFDKYYVAGTPTDSVILIDGATDSIVSRMSVGEHIGSVHAIVVAEPHGLVMAGKWNDSGWDPDSLFVGDAATGVLLSRTAIPRGPYSALYSTSSDRMYCACSTADSVVVLRGDDGGVARALRVGDAPFVLAYSPVNRRVYVGHLNCAWVFVIRDTVTGIAEESRSGVPRLPGVTVLGGVMRVGRAARLVDVTGRTVLPLEAGENDVSGLARGAYFVVSGCEPVGKVLLVR